jgi:hypothetical protein
VCAKDLGGDYQNILNASFYNSHLNILPGRYGCNPLAVRLNIKLNLDLIELFE